MKVDISYYKAGSRKGQVRKNHVVCSERDAFEADWVIAQMVLPLLLQVKKDKQGAPFVDDVYVPEELRSTACAPKENKWDTDENWFKRYRSGEQSGSIRKNVFEINDYGVRNADWLLAETVLLRF